MNEIKKTQNYILKIYREFLKPEIVKEALSDKISRTRIQSEKDKLISLSGRYESIYSELVESDLSEEPLCEETLRALHRIGSIAKAYGHRERTVMQRLRSGRLFDGIAGTVGDGRVVWDKGDEGLMRGSPHPFEMRPKRDS